MKKYRRKRNSQATVKKDDHGPDALMVALLNFRFENEFGPDIERAAALQEQVKILEGKKEKPQKDKVSFSMEGVATVTRSAPDFVTDDQLLPKDSRKNVLAF